MPCRLSLSREEVILKVAYLGINSILGRKKKSIFKPEEEALFCLVSLKVVEPGST